MRLSSRTRAGAASLVTALVLLVLAPAALLTLPGLASATILRVYPDGSGDYPTIAEALAAAAYYDTVLLGDGVFYEHDLVHPSRVSIMSESGDPSRTVIDADFQGRCMVGISVTAAPTVRGITFRNGVAPDEGGVLKIGNVNARFYDCLFRSGLAPRGGAVSVNGQSAGQQPHFYNCRFESSEAAAGDGGGVWSNGTGYFVECAFTDNVASGNGGAVYCNKDRDQVWLRTCVFESNSAGGDGGAVFSEGTDNLYGTWITNGVFRSNSAARGGAARLEQYDFAGDSSFLDNHATLDGGALYLVDNIVDKEFDYFSLNLFARNHAGERGGAIFVTGTTPFVQIAWSTFSENRAPEGSHIWSDLFANWGILYYSVLAFGSEGEAVGGSGSIEANCSDVYGNAGGDFVGPLAGQLGFAGNISGDPLFCDPSTDNYRLATGSECLPPLPSGCGTGYMGLYGWGCHESTTAVDEPEPSFAILQMEVSPSPASGDVVIRWASTAERPVRIEIHDVQGRLVRALGTPARDARERRWDGRDDGGRMAGSGVYFATATGAEGARATRRFVLLR